MSFPQFGHMVVAVGGLFFKAAILGTKEPLGCLVANDCFRLENAKIAPDIVAQQLTNLVVIKFREMIVQRPCRQQRADAAGKRGFGLQ